MATYPAELRYTREHEWAKIEGKRARVGITHYAQDQLGDVVFVELPKVGAKVTQMQTFGVVESVKAVSDLFAPLSGVVAEVNQELTREPERVNRDPYGTGWLVVIELANPRRGGEADERAAVRGVPRDGRRALSRAARRDDALPVHHRGAAGGDAARHRGRRPRGADRADPVEGAARPGADDPGRDGRRRPDRPPPRPRRAKRRRRPLRDVPRGRRLRPLHSEHDQPHAPPGGVLHRLHALPARGEPGDAALDLRVPDDDLRADRHGRHQRVPLRRRLGAGRGGAHGAQRDRAGADRRLRSALAPGPAGRGDVLRRSPPAGQERAVGRRRDRPRRSFARP